MATRQAPAGTVAFWKGVGGYDTCVKVRGRWYLVGNTMAANKTLHDYADSVGARMCRVGTPPPVQRAWKRHGANWAAVVRALPPWTSAVGLGTEKETP